VTVTTGRQGGALPARLDIEEAIYPFLGPNKSADGLEKARATLERSIMTGAVGPSAFRSRSNAQRKVVTWKWRD
jgi:hypothetical protein